VGDNDAAVDSGKVDPNAAGRIVSRIDAHADGVSRSLAGGGIGGFTGGHGQNLLAHDHHAVIHDGAHHDEKDGENNCKLQESLAFASPPAGAQLDEVRGKGHGSPA
jgi:hypothetical protein